MVFGINDDVDHNTYLSWNNVVCRIEEYAFFQMVLERNICTFDTWINHITGHHFQSLIQVLSEFLIWPMQVPDEGLECIELPEQIFWCGTTISKKGQIVDKYILRKKGLNQYLPFNFPTFFLEPFVYRLTNWAFHEIYVSNHLRSKGLA